jgi:hypothetical protein
MIAIGDARRRVAIQVERGERALPEVRPTIQANEHGKDRDDDGDAKCHEMGEARRTQITDDHPVDAQ